MRFTLLLVALTIYVQSYGQSGRPVIQELSETSLEDAGFNRDSIDNLIQLIIDTPPKDFRGLVVIKDNKLVIEEYFWTYWRNTVHDIRSAGKSITAILLGIAVKEGLVESLEQDVYSFFPKDKYPNINSDLKKIKLKHLLDMASGLDADTDRPETPGQAGQWMAMDDWKEYLLSVPLVNTPGEKWVYADINALLIGAVIEETSGISLKDYAQEKLFDPLGITQFYWYSNTSGQTGAAGNLYLYTLDFAKLGVLILNEGKWDNRQIIDQEYLKSLINKKSYSAEVSKWFPLADHYGLMWYKSQRTFGNKSFDYLFASGSGGNHLVVIPDQKMVIALTSSAYGPGPGQRRSYNILRKVLAALK